MMWMVLVIFPKGNNDYRGIGLLDPMWKVIKVVMDNRLKCLEYHDYLHGFLAGRSTGTAAMEVKLTQQLDFIEQVPLYGVFIDLRKAYDAMDRGRCLKIIEAYGVSPNMLRVIRYFWDHAVLVCHAGGVLGEPFRARRGVTQGGPLSPRIFDTMVDAIVREWLRRTIGDGAMAAGIGEEIRSFLAAFYADDGLIQSRDPARLQTSLDTLVSLFERVSLRTNTSKTKTMVWVPGRIRTCHSRQVYNERIEGHVVVGK